MSTDYPFSKHPLYGSVRDCDCCEAKVLVHDEPSFPGGNVPATLMLPDLLMLRRVGEIVSDAKTRIASGGAPVTEEEALISMLFDAYTIHRELLTRAVIHGVEGTGESDEEEDALRDDALLIAQDILRINLISEDTHPDVPRSIDLDIGHVIYELADERDCDCDDGGDGTTTICDVPDCPVHGDKPVPTTYEA